MSQYRGAMSNAQLMQRAMLDLQTRKITPDEFRATMRTLRSGVTQKDHDRSKGMATAMHTHNPNAR